MSGQFPRGGLLDWSGRKLLSSIMRIGLEAWHCEPADTFRGGYSRRGRCRLLNPSRHQNSLESRQPRARATCPQTYPQKIVGVAAGHEPATPRPPRPAPVNPYRTIQPRFILSANGDAWDSLQPCTLTGGQQPRAVPLTPRPETVPTKSGPRGDRGR